MFHQSADGVRLYSHGGPDALLSDGAMQQTELGQVRRVVEKRIREVETRLHLNRPSAGPSESPENQKPMPVSHKRVMRVIFDHQQEFLSNGQTIAIYIPTNTVVNSPTGLSAQDSSLTPPANQLSSPLASDLDYETDLYKTGMASFDLQAEFAELRHDKTHPAFSHDIHNSAASREANIPKPLSEPHVLLPRELAGVLNAGQDGGPNEDSALSSPSDTHRNTTLPSAFDSFICLGSGTIVL